MVFIIKSLSIRRQSNEFYKVTNAKKIDKDGTGLGLSIAKRIIERHSGKIWRDSQEDIETKFSFTLNFVRRNGNEIY